MSSFPTLIDDAGDIRDGLQVWSADRRSLCLERDGDRMMALLIHSSEVFLGALWNLERMELVDFWGRGADMLRGAALSPAENEERIFSEMLGASLPMSQVVDSQLGDFDLDGAIEGVDESGGGMGSEDAAHARALLCAIKAGRAMDAGVASAPARRSGGPFGA